MSRERWARLAAVAAGASVVLTATAASADESAYCKKVRARASSDAALLFAPTIQAQGIKFPNNGTIDSGVTTGAGYQFRAALSFSPLDIYKGIRVKRVGEADCQQHEDVVSAREILSNAADYGRLPALRSQASFIDAKRSEIETIAAKSEERVAAHVASIRDSAEVRGRVSVLYRAREQSAGDAHRIEARGVEEYRGSLSALVAAAEADTMKLEREASHVRKISAWDVRVTGGVIPQDAPIDYFGVVQVGFNFGAFAQGAAESRYLSARADELAKARYELRDELTRFRAQIKSANEQARRELDIVERQRAMLISDRSKLELSEGLSAAQPLGLIALDEMLLESQRIYLTTLIAELTKLENDHG